MNQIEHPEPFLTIRCEDMLLSPTLTGWCAGYENGAWRRRQLSEHLIEWLPEFALRYSEWQGLKHHNAVRMFAKAAKSIYTSKKFKARGEFGEILLHAMIRQKFNTIPAISKYFYKDANNDTVKGFDAVHVVTDGDDLELWLGEVKFYESLSDAIGEIVGELQAHIAADYLRSEFAAITNKIDESSPFSSKLKKLLDKNTSLDEVFARTCIPLLVTYDSKVLASHTQVSQQFDSAFRAEVLDSYKKLSAKLPGLPKELRVHVLLFPLESKKALIKEMDEVLKSWQQHG